MLAICTWLTLSFYHPTGTTQDLAAYGGRVVPGATCAVSRDLGHLRGKTIWIEGIGPRLVNDSMGPQARRRLDVAAWGKELEHVNQKKVKVCW